MENGVSVHYWIYFRIIIKLRHGNVVMELLLTLISSSSTWEEKTPNLVWRRKVFVSNYVNMDVRNLISLLKDILSYQKVMFIQLGTKTRAYVVLYKENVCAYIRPFLLAGNYQSID